MSEFIEKFTEEVEQSKKELVDDYEDRLVQERRKSDELKNKFYHAQSDIESKLDKLTIEVEHLRSQNKTLQLDKASAITKQNELFEQLETLRR